MLILLHRIYIYMLKKAHHIYRYQNSHPHHCGDCITYNNYGFSLPALTCNTHQRGDYKTTPPPSSRTRFPAPSRQLLVAILIRCPNHRHRVGLGIEDPLVQIHDVVVGEDQVQVLHGLRKEETLLYVVLLGRDLGEQGAMGLR